MKIIAHLAKHKSHSYPENSIDAVKTTLETGVGGVEVDIRLTKDKAIVLSHDPDTFRLTGQYHAIAEEKLSQLQTLDFGSGQRIATLDQVIPLVKESKSLFVEIKCGVEIIREESGKKGGSPLAKVLASSKVDPSNLAFIGFVDTDSRKETMRQLWHMFETYDVYALFGRRKGGELKALKKMSKNDRNKYIVEAAKSLGANGVDVRCCLVNEEMVKKARNEGLSYHVWDVNEIEEATLLREFGVDSITTDSPKEIKEALLQPKS